ncbi:MAG: hypothetical protein NPIRA02_00250 [Nitrospirales bacterium]|nr:MAG: hypothetical protein NPIRA02_00250 [Nitrospirales bacterium]
MYICVCKGIKELDVRTLGREGITCPKLLASTLGIDDKNSCCGRCIKNVSNFVEIAFDEHSRSKFSVKA